MNLPQPIRPRALETVRPTLPQVLHRVNGHARQRGYQPVAPQGASIVGASMAALIVDRLIESRGVHNAELPGLQPGSGLPPLPAPIGEVPLPAVRGVGDVLHLQYEVPGSFAHQPCGCFNGTIACFGCGGSGRTYCSPTRYTSDGDRPCFSCGGTGFIACSICFGTGRVICGRCTGTAWLSVFGLAEIRRETVRQTSHVSTPASPSAQQVADWARQEQRVTPGLRVPAEIKGEIDRLLLTHPGERYIDGRVRILPLTALRDAQGKTLAIVNEAGNQIILTAQQRRRRLLITLGLAVGILVFLVAVYLTMP